MAGRYDLHIKVEYDKVEKLKAYAQANHRNLANYIEWLVDKDIERLEEEKLFAEREREEKLRIISERFGGLSDESIRKEKERLKKQGKEYTEGTYLTTGKTGE